jgi:predicted phosphodiesterase
MNLKMNSTLILGDIHGNNIWKQIVEKENPDRVIFIGDYFDAWDMPAVIQIQNFKDIIEYKETAFTNDGQDNQHKTEVIMLIGNHDFHYFPEIGNQQYSGYQSGARFSIEHVINENRSHLQMAYKFGDVLCTHAGVSSIFMDNIFKDGWSVETVADQLNDLFIYQPGRFKFRGLDPYGDDVYQTPIWIRPRSLKAANHNTLRKKIRQVVGHTQIDKMDVKGKSTGGRYFFTDCLATSKEYLIFNSNNEAKINNA